MRKELTCELVMRRCWTYIYVYSIYLFLYKQVETEFCFPNILYVIYKRFFFSNNFVCMLWSIFFLYFSFGAVFKCSRLFEVDYSETDAILQFLNLGTQIWLICLCSFHSFLITLLDISMDNTGFGGYFLYLVSLFSMHFTLINLHLV